MQQWEYLFVFAAIASGGDEFRPRFANDQELDDWQAGPTMYEYANRLGERGWELFSCSPIVFTQSNWQPFLEAQPIASDLRAITMVFKRPKKEEDDSLYKSVAFNSCHHASLSRFGVTPLIGG